jgi:hypothetical protein
MSRRLLVLVVGVLTLLFATATTATAAEVQTVDQGATSGQAATAASTATQVQPSNTNISVRVLSPGNDGNVTQTNAVGSLAAAANGNGTTQLAGQAQLGTGGTAIQTADQSAANTQLAGALSTASQYGASNVNMPIRVGSSGTGGSVTQTNAVGSAAGASNTNATGQASGQTQAGSASPCSCAGGTGVQTADQSATSSQRAGAGSAATQVEPKNVNLDIRVGSSGSGGAVTQSNVADSSAAATNGNGTTQAAGQSQTGTAGTGVQTADQSASNAQGAAAHSSATQIAPKNVNLSVRVLSPGDNGTVTQTNAVGSAALAANGNETKQGSLQSQAGTGGCGCHEGSTGIQTTTQSAASMQGATAASAAKQIGASNVNMPIRVGSSGTDGSVTQTNAVLSGAIAENGNGTQQASGQSQAGGSGTGVQTIDQKALNGQGANAASAAYQVGASNTNAPIRVGSSGGGGSVTQANLVGSAAIASNANGTFQLGGQSQIAGRGCGCKDGIGIQALGQHASNDQGARAESVAVQAFPPSRCGCAAGGNSNAPIRVGSSGDDGRVTQTNAVGSLAAATNHNGTFQLGSQAQLGGAGIGIQALGQQAHSGQGAAARSGALQSGARNDNAPLRVGSSGSAGAVTQTNAVESEAIAANANWTKQLAAQVQHGLSACGCSGIGIQALGQSARNHQLGSAASAALQLAPSNRNAPTLVWSHVGGGSVLQGNAASSLAAALNLNRTMQLAAQFQL